MYYNLKIIIMKIIFSFIKSSRGPGTNEVPLLKFLLKSVQ